MTQALRRWMLARLRGEAAAAPAAGRPSRCLIILVGPAGVAGPVVVPLGAPTEGTSSGCASVDPDLIKTIMKNPEQYYVNVHTVDFPAGAVRGQLSK